MRFLLTLFVATCFSFSGIAQQSVIDDNNAYRAEMHAKFKNPKTSPLKAKDLEGFTSLPWFDIDPAFCVKAKFVKAEKVKKFEMETTTDRRPIFQEVGTAFFKIDGKDYSLKIYQAENLAESAELKDNLFLPFTDLSSGEESYGGGRFLDLKAPSGDEMVIDFNKAYNPYCVYNIKYSCPIPPMENFLEVKVLAGLRDADEY